LTSQGTCMPPGLDGRATTGRGSKAATPWVEVWKAVPVNQADWEQRLADAWASIDQLSDEQFLALIERLTAELPTDSGVGLFERAASLDSTGHADLAVPLYRQALQQGLTASADAGQ
jgi:hypothetical protein